MKKLTYGFLFLLATFSTNALAKENTPEANWQPINQIVAIVNDTVITENTLKKQFAFFKHQLKEEGRTLPPDNILREQVLQHIISNDVQVELAERNGIKISNDQLNSSIASMAQKKKISVEQLYKEMAALGLTKSEYRAQVKDELAINELIKRDVASRIIISDTDIAAYKLSQQVKDNANIEYLVNDILVPVPSAPTTKQIMQAQKEADSLYKKIIGGLSFDQAKFSQHNNQQGLSDEGLGWRKFGELPALFASTVAGMSVGEVAKPIKAPNGYHILMLKDKRETQSTEKLTDEQIREILFKQQFYVALQSWMGQVTAQAYINTDFSNGKS